MESSHEYYVMVIIWEYIETIMQEINCSSDIVSSLLSEVFLAQLKLNHN